MVDDILKHMEKEYGIVLKSGRIVMENREVFYFTGTDLRLKGTQGLHLGTIENGFRPTIDACQLATKGFLEVDEADAKRWMCGLNLDKEAIGDYVLVKFGKYILGPGKPRNGKILNNFPKNRRLPLRSMG